MPTVASAADDIAHELSVLIDTLPDGGWVWNLQQDTLYLSPRWKQMLGYADHEIENRPCSFFSRLHPQDVATVEQAVEAHLRGDSEYYEARFRLQCRDGGYKWVKARGKATFDGDGRPHKFIGLHEDLGPEMRAAQVEQKLRIFEKIVSSSHDLMGYLDLERRYRAVNIAYLATFQRQEHEILGRTPVDLVGEEQYQRLIRPALDRCFAGQTLQREDWIDLPAGRRYLQAMFVPYWSPYGTVEGVVICARDQTQWKLAEDALRESETRFRAIFEGALEGIIVADADTGRFLFCNPRIAEMLGYERQELLGLDPSHTHPAAELPRMREIFQAQASGRVPEAFTLPMQRKDGTVFYAENSIHRVMLHGQQCLVGFFRDITQRRQAEEELRQSRERLQIVLDSIDAIVYLADIETHELLFINETGKRVSGDITGQKCWQAIQNLTGPCPFCTNDRLLTADGQPAGIVRWEHRNLINGRWYDCRDRAIRWTDGRMVRMEIATDITEMKRIEQSLQQLNESLEERVVEKIEELRARDNIVMHQARLAAMGEMVHNIAHQWRQPLNALGLILQNLDLDFRDSECDRERLTADTHRAMALIESMSRTIDDFRRFFRPETHAVDFDTADAVREAITVCEPVLKHHDIVLEKKLSGGLWAHGYPHQFAQAVLNLIVNAKDAILQHSVAGGRIDLALRADHDFVVLTVADNGGGIHAGLLDRIFEPYFTTKPQGSGIGLYMARMIVEQHMKGTLRCANAADGAVFTLTLPRCAATTHPPAA